RLRVWQRVGIFLSKHSSHTKGEEDCSDRVNLRHALIQDGSLANWRQRVGISMSKHSSHTKGRTIAPADLICTMLGYTADLWQTGFRTQWLSGGKWGPGHNTIVSPPLRHHQISLVILTSRFEATRGLFWVERRNFEPGSNDEGDTCRHHQGLVCVNGAAGMVFSGI
ncbi:hypothetical protein AVEN_53114-1, partial [Araneus ventricosus]